MSSLSNHVEVLIVGAGPAGLLAALELARSGIEVAIIDLAWRTTSQSYGCGLHPATLSLLADRGLLPELLESGRISESFAFFEGSDRKAELRFAEIGGNFPHLLLLPQDRLEQILEDNLAAAGVRVHWGHRLDDLREEPDAVTATVEKLALTSVGYPFARSEEMVDSIRKVQARFVIGADGCASHVRSLLDIPVESTVPPSAFEMFEFVPEREAGSEGRVAMGSRTTDVFWPQSGSLCRWSIEHPGDSSDHARKERTSVLVLDEVAGAENRDRANQQLSRRAPWYDAGIKEIGWMGQSRFETMRAARFGRGRCWLVGDAGHQTSPVGLQSMNIGLREACDLTHRLASILRKAASPRLLEEYDEQRGAEWRHMLGGTLAPGHLANAWTRAHARRILPCLPGSGPELEGLARQLGLELAGG